VLQIETEPTAMRGDAKAITLAKAITQSCELVVIENNKFSK